MANAIPIPTHPLFQDLTNRRFGKLLVLAYSGQNKAGQSLWECICECGNARVVPGHKMTSGRNKGCGCTRLEKAREATTRHGNAKRGRVTLEYRTWNLMHRRCRNPNSKEFEHYGAKGITVCERWNSFENFLADMGPKPSSRYTIDRIKNEVGYTPTNCRWVCGNAQSRNRRCVRLLNYKGALLTYQEAAKFSPIGAAGIRNRIASGWPDELAISAPRLKPPRPKQP